MRLWKKRDAENRHLEILSQKGKEGEKRPHLYPRRNGWGGDPEHSGRQDLAGQTSLYGGKAGLWREARVVGTLLPTSPQGPKDKLTTVAAGPSPTLMGKRNLNTAREQPAEGWTQVSLISHQQLCAW